MTNRNLALVRLVQSGFALSPSLHAGSRSGLPELQSPQFRYRNLIGFGPQIGVSRRDPSDVIRAHGIYYVWYTKVTAGPGIFMYPSGYSGSIWYATSPDGFHWSERGQSLARGATNDFDSGGVFTPNILEAQGKFYLFYTAVRSPASASEQTALGVAEAPSPNGPWKKAGPAPVLVPSTDPDMFDSFRVDDTCLIVRQGSYWLYYKGRQQGHTPQETKWGVAIASAPEGPYRKSPANPVVPSGHEVLVWPDGGGVAALVGPTGPEKNTIQYAADGLHFQIVSHILDPPAAPGAYRKDGFRGGKRAPCIRWGIAMRGGRDPYLVRWEYEARGGGK